MTTLIIYIIISLAFSAFFSGMEIAFVSSNKMLFEMEREERNFTSRIIDIFYRHQSNFLSTLLVGNNIALSSLPDAEGVQGRSGNSAGDSAQCLVAVEIICEHDLLNLS